MLGCLFVAFLFRFSAHPTDIEMKLETAAGVYNNKLQSSRHRLEKTVLISMIVGIGDYLPKTHREYLMNWLCFSGKFSYKPLVFIPVKDVVTYATHISTTEINKINPLANVITYSYTDSATATKSHRKLALIHNILKGGYDVIYFDVDVIFIEDPLPYILRGKTEIVIAPEVDSCGVFPSQRIPFSDKHFSVLPEDPSILFIRSSILRSISSDFLPSFLKNSQRLVKFTSDQNNTDCATVASVGAEPATAPAVSICLLNEFLFQNGIQITKCSQNETESSTYFLGLIHMGHRSEAGANIVSPVTLHVDHCSDKKATMKQLGLWLLTDDLSTCVLFDYKNTLFSSSSWTTNLRKGMHKVTAATSEYPQGSLVKLPLSSSTIYMVDKGRLRAFSSGDVFMKLKFEWTDILYMDASSMPLLHVLPFGPLVTPADSHLKSYSLAGKKVEKKQVDSLFNSASTVNTSAHFLGYKFDLWARLSREAKLKEPNRLSDMKTKLANVAGVYRDKTKSMKLGLQKTVLVSILAPAFEDLHGKYTQLLRNWFCYAAQYGYQPLTFLVPSKSRNFTALVSELHHVGVKADFVTYPDEFFWKLLLRKKSPIVSFRRANYDGNIPSFENFGALTMLVPSLEVLEHGYDVIYFDLDIALVRDPVPYMLKGDADFLLSHESRACVYPSLLEFAAITDWERLEPNTGIFMARATPGLLALFRQWMDKIVDQNIMNDQKVLKLAEFGAQLSFSCNGALEHLEANKSSVLSKPLLVTQSDVKYCFLNELLFQNGKVCVNCAKGRGGSQAEYFIALNKQKGARITVDDSTASGSALKFTKTLLAPVAVHVNFCDDKIGEFKDIGLWLPQNLKEATRVGSASRHCKYHDIRKTVFATTNWDEKLAKAVKDVTAAQAIFVNGTVLKLWKIPTTYLFMDGKLHAFPDGETFLKMGYQWNQIKHVPLFSFYKLYPNGPDIPSLVVTS